MTDVEGLGLADRLRKLRETDSDEIDRLERLMEQQRTLLEDFIENAVSVIEEAEFRGDLDLVELLAGFVLAAHRILNASRGDLLRRLEVSEGE